MSPLNPRTWASVALLFLLLASSASAQTCPEALADAEARYIEGAFGTVVGLLDPCLDDTARSVPARRLLALSYLRLGQITEAKLTLLRLLTIEPTYQADPLQDPPAYMSLVQVVQAQLAAGEAETPPPATEAEPTPPEREPPSSEPESAPVRPRVAEQPTPPPVRLPPPPPERRPDLVDTSAEPTGEAQPASQERSAPDLSIRYWLGAGSYGGERGAQGSGPVQGFVDNAGFGIGVGVSGPLLPGVELFGDLEAVNYPTLPTDPGADDTFDPVEVDTFSPWVRFATAGVRVTALRHRGVSLYGALGGGLASGDQGTGGAVSGGLGVDFTFLPATGAFFDGTWTLVSPARAIDAAADESAVGDVFSALRFGLRYRLDVE